MREDNFARRQPQIVSRPTPSTILYSVPRKTFAASRIFTPAPKAIEWQARVQDYPGCQTPCDDTAHGKLTL